MKKKPSGDAEWKGLPEEEKARHLLKGIEVPPFVFDVIEILENPVLGPDDEVLGMEPARIRKERIGTIRTVVELEIISKELGDRILEAFEKAAPARGKKAKPGPRA